MRQIALYIIALLVLAAGPAVAREVNVNEKLIEAQEIEKQKDKRAEEAMRDAVISSGGYNRATDPSQGPKAKSSSRLKAAVSRISKSWTEMFNRSGASKKKKSPQKGKPGSQSKKKKKNPQKKSRKGGGKRSTGK